MLIHTVSQGETLYNIARKYSVPATKILADNDLCGDRITVGDELIILMPTRTVTVRGGETLDTISKRFDVKKAKLLANNPSLCGKAALRPGQILTVKQDTPTLGSASALGLVEKGCRRENFTRSLPYLTYIAVMECVLSSSEIQRIFDGSWSMPAILKENKIPLLGIREDAGNEWIGSEKASESLVDKIIKAATYGGYKGVYISARSYAGKYPRKFCEFILELRKRFIGCDLILFVETDSNSPSDASELADGGVFIPSDVSIDKTKDELLHFANRAESSKVMIGLSSTAAFQDTRITIPEAKHLCYRSGLSLKNDETTLMSCFDYRQYRTGKSSDIRVSFPSVKYTKAKLEYLS